MYIPTEKRQQELPDSLGSLSVVLLSYLGIVLLERELLQQSHYSHSRDSLSVELKQQTGRMPHNVSQVAIMAIFL
jgi:hypothetical protein